MGFPIPEDLKMLQATVRKFVQEELLPVEKQVETTDEFPDDIRLPLKKKAVALGLWNYTMPREYGGGGVNTLGRVLACEELGQVSIAVGLTGGIVGGPRSGMGKGGEFAHATRQQIDKYFLPVLRGEQECFMALTEPNAGSDLGAIETRAVKDGNSWVLNGRKTYVTAIDVSHFGLVLAVSDWEKRRKGGISCFIVERNNPGLKLVRQIPLMGRRSLHSYEVELNDCRVPAENLFGEAGHGLEVAASELGATRIECAATCIGVAQRALKMAKDYAKKRVTFGEPLARRQTIQNMITHAEEDIYASRLMIWDAATDADEGKDINVKAMMIKAFATERAVRIINDAMQIHGGLGYTRDLPLEMMYRDVRLYTIGEGGTELLEWVIARNLLKD
ncbi:MAG: acyl-CoA/acyl-ACP dehydrogenase [Chloroflexi bacterium]|nr:acyl-CoA/acyl-ACP dehydrogenase [Chloroflexota bacterium]